MKLTRYQLKILIKTQKLGVKGVTFWGYFRKPFIGYFILIAELVFCYWAGIAQLSWFVGGALLGVFLRDAGRFWQYKQLVPLNNEIINWDRVSQLIIENSHEDMQLK